MYRMATCVDSIHEEEHKLYNTNKVCGSQIKFQALYWVVH